MAIAYAAWLDNARIFRAHQDRLSWKRISGRDYLYRIVDRAGNGTSLGPRSAETEAFHADYVETRTAAKQARKTLAAQLDELGRVARAVRLPSIDATAGAVLVEADIRQMLGSALMAVGTNALLAYAYAAAEVFPAELQATADFDMAWAGSRETFAVTDLGRRPLLGLLKAVDSTFTVSTRRSFQARNAEAYEIELLAAPSVSGSIPASEPLRPVGDMHEQEWLLRGTPIREIVRVGTSGVAALVAPDPRWFALHKAWLSQKPGRNRRKVAKDAAQGRLLWRMVCEGAFPLHPVDPDFRDALPPELADVVVDV